MAGKHGGGDQPNYCLIRRVWGGRSLGCRRAGQRQRSPQTNKLEKHYLGQKTTNSFFISANCGWPAGKGSPGKSFFFLLQNRAKPTCAELSIHLEGFAALGLARAVEPAPFTVGGRVEGRAGHEQKLVKGSQALRHDAAMAGLVFRPASSVRRQALGSGVQVCVGHSDRLLSKGRCLLTSDRTRRRPIDRRPVEITRSDFTSEIRLG